MRLRILLYFLLFSFFHLQGQTGREFWFGAPDISSSLGDKPVNIIVTALYETNVTISRPADNSFTPVTFYLNSLEHRTLSLDEILGASGNWETIPQDASTGGQPKGFLIESEPGEINVYFEIDHTPDNRDIMPLKGEAALGRQFTVSTQNMLHNSASAVSPWSGFVIVATKDNTNITIYPNGNIMYYFPGPPASINLALNRGETFSFRSYYPDSSRHLNGINVVSDKNIGITIYDDGLNKGCAFDLMADQIVPDKYLGSKYIIQRGYLDTLEAVFATATANNTTISINGIAQGIYNKNEVFRLIIPPEDKITELTSSNPVYAMHMSGIDCKVGGALLPSFEDCVGSHELAFTRTKNVTDAFYIRLIGQNETNIASPYKNQAINNFYMVINNDTTKIPSSYFEYTPDSSFVYLTDSSSIQAFIANQITPGKQVKIYNNVARFHFGTIMGGPSNGMKYGYCSNYTDYRYSAGIGGFSYVTDTFFCDLEPIRLVAHGGINYVWTSPSNPSDVDLLSDDSIAAPYFYPDETGEYNFEVEISGVCHVDTTIHISSYHYYTPTSVFDIDEQEGCSPHTTTITNTSDSSHSAKMIWSFEPSGILINQDTIDYSFDWNFASNLTDTLVKHTVTLYSYSEGGYCYEARQKEVRIYPEVNSGFAASDVVGCSPHFVEFDNLTTSGHALDSLKYSWDFQNGTQSVLFEPEISFTNYSLNDTIFPVELIAESPYGCEDTTVVNITVHPRVEAVFSTDTSFSCSPITVNLDPSGSIGADSLIWNFNLVYSDSIFKTDIISPYTLTHYDTSMANGPDTLFVTLLAKNSMGCIDTSETNELIVYPRITAQFDITTNTICDADTIIITNQSDGYNPLYEWSFGDNTFLQDTTVKTYYKKYYNRSNTDTVYNLKLKAVSEGVCESYVDTNIVVHPYLKADFGFEYSSNCSPLLTEITNTSIRVQDYFWDLGDGTTSTSNAASFTHLYSNSLLFSDTTFTIKLTATSAEGCIDSLIRNLTLLPQVISDFSISDTAICSPETIGIQNNSSGSSLTYLWDFDDGLSSTTTAANFNKYFENFTNNDTTYTISLVARNDVGCSDTSEVNLMVLAYIDSYFSIPKTDSCSPFTIHLQNLSSEGAGVYHWDLGPSGLSTQFEPSNPVYTNLTNTEDTVYISLAVAGTDDALHWACSDTHVVEVLVYPEMNADFTMDNYNSCQPYKGEFTNLSEPAKDAGYIWYLDNVFYSNKDIADDITILNNTIDSVSHTLWLYATSKYGCKDTASQEIVVYSLVDAYFTINKDAICPYDSLYIDRQSSNGGITSYEWNFNNESVFTSSNPTFYFSNFNNTTDTEPIDKTISLTVRNIKDCTSEWYDTVQVYPTVVADFELDTNIVCYPHTTRFINLSQNANSYIWELGDGISVTSFEPEHLYGNFSTEADSVYKIELIAVSAYNCTDSISSNLTIKAKPKASFYFEKTIDCPPFEAEMINNSTGAGLSYFWNFANEGSSTDVSPSFLFTNNTNSISDKPISLNIESVNGCSDSITKNLSVYPNVDTAFSYSVTEGCSPLRVDFTSLADETNIQQILWYVDDLAFSNITSPRYRFVNNTTSNKTFEVKFKVYSVYNCSDSAQVEITAYPTPAVNFVPEPITAEYNTEEDRTRINIENLTYLQNNWSYAWDFGDGNTGNQQDVFFDYYYGDHFWGENTNNNKIPITLTGWNTNNPECRDSVQYSIIIKPPLPEVDIFEDLTGCQPFTIDFSAYTKYIYDNSYYWEFGVTGDVSEEDAPVYTFEEAGTYLVRLTVEGEGGTHSDYKTIVVKQQPQIDFAFNDTIVFAEQDEVNFYNYTLQGEYYDWYFNSEDLFNGLPPNSNDTTPIWTYITPGIYQVALVSKSAEDCYDTLIHPQEILVLQKGEIEFPNAFYLDPGNISEEMASNQSEDGGNLYLFYPKHNGVYDYYLEIYNRWGTLIFESYDINQGWNGTIDGAPAKQDVYVWRVRGHYANGLPYDISGDVTLIRKKYSE
ncbi:MAG: gliding motility-associated C-terminal domain-containing protein [Bacteroidales bacterium]|nr:gliding motility-associated C-terminal domain-containing protein [Bacteroidales bacterium]MBN2818499.1 gliding motility-associated C-terminal domain-containing protein [Bacteroidales bacterium]